jgi:two-component system response regulator CpxR
MRQTASLLVVDDDVELVRMLGELLAGEGFITHHAQTGLAALDVLEERDFDLVILDVMMPGLDGLSALCRLRRDKDTPVLMLTARGEDDDRIRGLELGADDYLSKPFNPRELIARVRAILRRYDKGAGAPRPPVSVGVLALDPAELSVVFDGRAVRLTAAEFMVLEALARAPGRMQSRAVLTEQALGRVLEAYDRSIDTHVSSLRRKLGLSANGGMEIRAVRGLGYVLTAGAAA